VLNDCIGFAGPLLLNKLIRFLQQGFAANGHFFFSCDFPDVEKLVIMLSTASLHDLFMLSFWKFSL
jgi:hypothetical protein